MLEQDFYANIYLSNMLIIAKEEANAAITKKDGLKYECKVNYEHTNRQDDTNACKKSL